MNFRLLKHFKSIIRHSASFKMQEAYVNICDIPTHVMTYGKWIEGSWGNTKKEVVIILPGNPGLPGFYTKFSTTIQENLGHEIPIWIVGQVGHDDPPASSIRKVPVWKGHEKSFDLDGQIKHKVEFIRNYVPDGVKIHLVGHSIGSWMALELLKHSDIKKKVKKCYLLFPTVEKMADSPNGKKFLRFVSPIFFLLKCICSFFMMMPYSFQSTLIWAYFFMNSIPRYFMGTALKYLNPNVIERSFYLAMDEMNRVRDLDLDNVKANKSILKFYYGKTDGWTPIKYYEDLKRRVPDVDAELDQRKIAHAFVLRSSVDMGQILADWILKQ